MWVEGFILKMAGIPQNFQSISPVLSNYNFVDIASGTGYINFYAGNTVDKILLSNFTYYSNVIYYEGNTVGVNDTVLIDKDFDTVLNRPLDLKGIGIVNVGVYTSAACTIYITATLRKWNGVTETDIVTNDSSTYLGGSATYKMLSIDLDIPITHFKVGETLRLTIQLKETASSAGRTVRFANDPLGRTTGWDTTGAVPSRLMFQCPVRLNL